RARRDAERGRVESREPRSSRVGAVDEARFAACDGHARLDIEFEVVAWAQGEHSVDVGLATVVRAADGERRACRHRTVRIASQRHLETEPAGALESATIADL